VTSGVSSEDPPAVLPSHMGGIRDERDRIAARLLETVIRRLFAAGLSMNAAAAELEGGGTPGAPGRAVTRIDEAMVLLDEAIVEIRSAVYQPTPLEHLPWRARGRTGRSDGTSSPSTPPATSA
jgi:signal transduction histidine kinase